MADRIPATRPAIPRESQGTTERASLRAAVARHPVAAFLVLVFAFTGFIQTLPTPELVHGPVENIVGAAVPAFVVTALVAGRDGVRDLVRRSLRWRVRARWYAVALLGPPLALLAVSPALYGTAPLRGLAENWPLLFTSFLPTLAFLVVFANVAEEVGWTGFVFARLQDRHRPLAAALLAFVPFLGWHLIGFVHDTGSVPDGLVLAGLLALPLLASRVITGWLYNGAGASVLIAGLFHAAFNATVHPYGFGATVLGLPHREMPYVVGGLVVVAALAVALATRGRLGRARALEARPSGSNRTRGGANTESGSR